MTAANRVRATGVATVVVPCRNAAAFLPDLLDSLQNQTMPPYEILVIDDGSTDSSAAVAEAWAQAHRLPVRVVRQPPLGVAAALNRGVAEASTDLVARADADDVVHPRWLELLACALQRDPAAGYAYPAMRMFGQATGRYYSRPFDAASLVFEGNFVCCGALMRREAYHLGGGTSELPAWEDWDLWLKFLTAGYHGTYVDEELYLWRRHGRTRNQLKWWQRRQLRARIWWRHRDLLVRYRAGAITSVARRARHRVTVQ